MSRRLRAGIIGCGKVAHLHAPALLALDTAELAAACDANVERAAAFVNQYGGKPYNELAPMLRDIDLLIVCTPHPLHAEATIAAASAGVHILVEKPLASTVADCDGMILAAARSGVLLGTVSQRRFFKPVQRMKAAIDAGRIGTPVLGAVAMFSWRDEAYYRSDPWRGRWDTEGGGVLINQSPHHIDILQWLMGPVEEVVGRWANLNHPFVEVEDTALGILRFRSGALASLTLSLSQKPGLYTKIHVHGSNGASVGAETDSGATFIAGMSNVAAPALNDIWTIPGEEDRLASFQEEDRRFFDGVDATAYYHALQVQDFVEAIQSGREPCVSGEEGRKVVRIIEAIYRSGREGIPVQLD